jgi:phosphoglycerate dehydrogenase-like enzyme
MPDVTVAVILDSDQAAPEGLDLIDELADVRLVHDPVTFTRALEEAEAVFAWDFRTTLLGGPWPRASPLRWIHAGSVGVDAVLVEPVLSSEVIVTNTRGVFERPIAEYVLALILAFVKDLPTTLSLQRGRRWVHRETEMIRGRRVLVLGAGGVSRELVPLLRAAGMEVDVVGRIGREADPVLGRVLATTEVERALPGADFIVLALPLTAETREYLDQHRLGLLHPGARIINVGRGALIDEAALLAALDAGAIAGAALDVFAAEPLPAEHPFWTMDQVIVSPHMSGDRLGWERVVVERFAENLRRWLAGEPLLDVVDKRGLASLAAPASEGAARQRVAGAGRARRL